MTPLETVRDYHERTKHRLDRSARSLGYLDWATQPDPFRRFETPPIALDLTTTKDGPAFDAVLGGALPSPRPLGRASVSQLFEDALALSAWKEAGRSRWSLRVNPSSGNLHPTEGYLLAPAIEGLTAAPGLFHYQPLLHALEPIAPLSREAWSALSLPRGAVLVGLTSIHWREAWKYGERAYRYCQHDVGHAVAALAIAAGALGWRTRVLEGPTTEALARLLCVDRQQGPEAEEADCLVAVWPHDAPGDDAFAVPDAVLDELARSSVPAARPLSAGHEPWEIIDAVAEAARKESAGFVASRLPANPLGSGRNLPVRPLLHQRRSAVSFDGRTGLSRASFLRLLAATVPERSPTIFGALPWEPCIQLAVFVHRVEGLAPGLYLLARDATARDELRALCRDDFAWTAVDADGLDLTLLAQGNARDAARTVSCQQDIAADGAFSLGMLARFDASLERHGAWFYPRLFREAGAVGQALYLAAEAEGVRGTGIGCFFDDAVHSLLGLAGTQWQSLYHFTVGTPVDDLRLRTLEAYEHREAALAEAEAEARGAKCGGSASSRPAAPAASMRVLPARPSHFRGDAAETRRAPST